MAYELGVGEPIPDAVLRVMREQIDRIAARLDASDGPAKRVHDVRKRMKETRALLRLVRAPLGAQFRIENAWYRDAAHELASARETAAMIESIRKLEKRSTDPGLQRRLAGARRSLKRLKVVDPAPFARLLAQLDDARTRLDDWPKLEDRFRTIGQGLERTYADGRRALAAARRDPSPENVHELRKRVKDHWYHTQLLRAVWPAMMKDYAHHVEDLSAALGDHHDLIVLRRTLLVEPSSFGTDENAQTVLAALEPRLRELEKAALEMARRVLAERPKAWRRRMRALWRAQKAAAPPPAG